MRDCPSLSSNSRLPVKRGGIQEHCMQWQALDDEFAFSRLRSFIEIASQLYHSFDIKIIKTKVLRLPALAFLRDSNICAFADRRPNLQDAAFFPVCDFVVGALRPLLQKKLSCSSSQDSKYVPPSSLRTCCLELFLKDQAAAHKLVNLPLD